METLNQTKIEIGHGSAQEDDSFSAGRLAAAKALSMIHASPVVALIVFASVKYDLPEVLRGIGTLCPEPPLFGCTTACEICNEPLQESVVVTVLASPYFKVSCGLGREISKDWQSAVDGVITSPAIHAYFDDVTYWQELTLKGKSVFAILFSPGNTRDNTSQSYEILEAIKVRSLGRLPVFGGSTADDWRMETNYVLCGDEVIPDGMLLAVFETQLQFGIAMDHGFIPTPQQTTVTRVRGHEVLELDGYPAADVFARIIGSERAELDGKHLTLTTGHTMGTSDSMGQYSINVASFITPTGGINFTQPVTASTVLTLMEPDAKNMHLAGQNALRKAIMRGGVTDPALSLVAYCALRPKIGGEKSLEEMHLMTEMLAGSPLVGFCSFGEQGVADDGTIRHNNGVISVLVLGSDLSPNARVALENEKLWQKLEHQTVTLSDTNRDLLMEITERKRIEAILQEAHADLESRVNDRTIELSAANEKLRHEILEKNQAEVKLQQSNLRFKTLADATFEGIAITQQGRYVDLNKHLAQILGYERSELIGMEVANTLPPEEHDRVLAYVMSGNESRMEHVMLRKDGSRRFVEAHGKSIEQNGRKLRLTAVRDITDRKKMEQALQDSEERYRTLFDESPFGVVLVDPETFEVLHFNPAACNNLGYEPDEFSRLHVMDFAVMEKQEEIKMRSEQVLHHGGVSFETIHRTKQGALRNVMIDLKLITVAGKQMIQSIIRDITESKRSQQLLELYLYALDNAKDQIFMNDRTSRFIYVNQAACTTLGYSRDELLGMGMGVSDIDPNFPTEAWEDHWQDLQTQAGLRLETSHRSKDGRIYPVEMSLKAFVFDKTEYLLAVARDLTERKQQEAEKLEMERRLLHSQKLESLGVLAGGIAHDFNNILTSIVGNADLALMRINKDSPGVDNLHRIEEAAARAADLAKQMLAYSGKGQFVVEHINLNCLLEGMMQLLEVSISKKAELRFNLTPNLPSVKVDTTQIRQIVMNLVINAAEAIGDKSGVIAITTGCLNCEQRYLKEVWLEDNLKEGLYVYFEIADTGCGMDRETVTKIFDPFFTTKFTGRGLGMAAVLGIVRGHKGAIKVHSEPNKGSSFKILLPVSDRPVELFNHVNEQDNWLGKGTVLLVDDEETIRSIGREMLQELGFTTITASDGREALEIFKTTPDIAFIILDLTMPSMGGEQCFRELREINPDVKVIMSSGFSEHEVTQKFVGKGMAGFIQKPYKLSVLKDAIYSLKLSATN